MGMGMKKFLGSLFALLFVGVAVAQELPQEQRADVGRMDRVLAKGYRGYAEVGGSVDMDLVNTFGILDLATSHGYQFSPHFFLGVGVGVQVYSSMEVVQVPVFGEMRFHLLKKWVSPFASLRAGYSVSENKGAYFNPMVGVRFGFKKHFGLNVGVGYTCQKNAYMDDAYMGVVEGVYGDINAVTLRVGFDF